MRKSLLAIMLTLLFAVSVFALASCGGGGGDTPAPDNRPEIDGVTFNGATYTYDGTEKSIEVSGLPEGATVTYTTSNKATNAGSYAVNATVKLEGHKDLTVTATLVIEPKEIDIEWGDLGPFASVGEEPEIEYTVVGALDGDEVNANISFGDCDFTEEGEFTFTVTLDNSNYKLKSEDKALDFEVGGSEHKVTFDAGDGKEPDVEQVEHNDAVDKPRRDPSRLGYEFDGWYYGDKAWDFDTPVTKNMTLTAKWKAIEYTITYTLNGGENNPANPTVYTLETGATVYAPIFAGKQFLGWFEDSAFSVPFSGIEQGKTRRNVYLYAKWDFETEYNEIYEDKNLPEMITGGNHIISATYRYTFAANLKSFGENGVIYIGRGKDAVDGSYVEITGSKISVYTNGEAKEIVSDVRSHGRKIGGFIVVDIKAENGNAEITVRTQNGEYSASFINWSARAGAIFADAKDCELVNVSFSSGSDEYNKNLWIIGDSSIGSAEKESWTYQLVEGGFREALLMGANGADSTALLTAFEKALEYVVENPPKYVVWSFAKESGADYDKNVSAFVELCKKNGIIPVLALHSELICADNAAKNSFVKSSGEKYIDFAAVTGDNTVENGDYTELGAKQLFAKALVDLPELMTPSIAIREAAAETVLSGEKITIGANKVRDGKFMVFTAKIDGVLDGDEKIILGHGYMESYAKWIEITATDVVLCSYTSWVDPALTERASSHKITIKNYVTVVMTQDNDGVGNIMTILTDGASYTKSGYGWNSCQGEVFASSKNITLTDAKLSWTCADYNKPIWFVGASYFSLGDPARWPYYMYADKLTEDVFITGRGGMDGKAGLEEIRDALKYGKPEIMVWGIGMNDGADKNGDINPKTYANKIEFLQICKENGIQAVFMTIPNCGNEKNQNNDNTYKLAYVNNRLGDFANYDYRVVNIEHSVNGYEAHAPWYENMLHSDGTHPTNLGARNFYMQLLCDFPELMLGADAKLYKSEADTLSAGSVLSIDGPEYLTSDMAIAFMADFSGDLSGTIEIGNGKDVNGGYWVEISKSNIKVYRNVGGVASEVHSVENPANMRDIVLVRIMVKNNKASIALVSSGVNEYDSKETKLFKFTVDWGFAGDIFAVASSEELKDASLKWVVK